MRAENLTEGCAELLESGERPMGRRHNSRTGQLRPALPSFPELVAQALMPYRQGCRTLELARLRLRPTSLGEWPRLIGGATKLRI